MRCIACSREVSCLCLLRDGKIDKASWEADAAGYVGYFCLAAGVNLACNVEVCTPLPANIMAAMSPPLGSTFRPENGHYDFTLAVGAGHHSLCLQPKASLHCSHVPVERQLTRQCLAMQINTFQSWKNIANADALIKLAPAAGATLLLLLTLKFGRNPLALPAVLVCIPVSCLSRHVYVRPQLWLSSAACCACLHLCGLPVLAHSCHAVCPWRCMVCMSAIQ